MDGYQLTTLISDTLKGLMVPQGIGSVIFLYLDAAYGLEKASKINMGLISKNRIESNGIID